MHCHQLLQALPDHMPEVSFIVAAFNVAHYVAAAIGSALQQADAEVEVIVVDDASSDGTADIVEEIAERDARVRLVRRANTGGPSVARNTAMEMARGSWLAILDADDLILPERTRRLLDLATATAADMVADNFRRFSEESPLSSTMIAEAAEPYAFYVDVASFIRGNVMFDRGARLGYVKPMFRAAFIREHGIRHRENVLVGEDYHLCLSCLLARARFVVTSKSYYQYRVRAGSLSWRLKRSDIDDLLRAHEASQREEAYPDNTDVADAARAYARALERARALALAIENAKAGRWPNVLAGALRRPAMVPLLARFGGEAVGKRLKLFASPSG
jgi:succinoglycan biosynthesis protein ExoO